MTPRPESRISSPYRSWGGMCWPVPGERADELNWQLRYAHEHLPHSALLVALRKFKPWNKP